MEDSPVIGALVSKTVEWKIENITVVAAAAGKEGFGLLKKRRPYLVILDSMMPGFGGKFLLEQPSVVSKLLESSRPHLEPARGPGDRRPGAFQFSRTFSILLGGFLE